MPAWAGSVLAALVKPFLALAALFKAKQSGREEARQEQQDEANEAVRDRLEAERRVRDADRDELRRMLVGSTDE